MNSQKVKIKNYYRGIENDDSLRIELYGLLSEIILSKELFKKNNDINDLLTTLNLEYKDYVMKSRTNILARIIRDIERLDSDELMPFYKKVGSFLFPDIYNSEKNKKKISSNKIDDILLHFEGSDKN